MNLYDVAFDGEHRFVAARDFGDAQRRWLDSIRAEPDNADFDDSPESLHLIAEDSEILWPDAPAAVEERVTDLHDAVRVEQTLAPLVTFARDVMYPYPGLAKGEEHPRQHEFNEIIATIRAALSRGAK